MPRIEPIQPVILHLLAEMKIRFPKATPFQDGQEWSFPLDRVTEPGTWAVTVAARVGGKETQFKTIPSIPIVAAKIIHFNGPPRVFLVGWDQEAGKARCVSAPLVYE